MLSIDSDDEDEIVVAIDRLEKRCSNVDAARTELNAMDALFDVTEAELDGFFEALKLENSSGAREQLEDALVHVPEWNRLREEIASHEKDCRRLEASLGPHIELVETDRALLEEQLRTLPEREAQGIDAGKERAILEDRLSKERASTEISRLEGKVEAMAKQQQAILSQQADMATQQQQIFGALARIESTMAGLR